MKILRVMETLEYSYEVPDDIDESDEGLEEYFVEMDNNARQAGMVAVRDREIEIEDKQT